MNNIKNGWENIDEFVGIPGYGITSVELFIKGRSATIYNKVRGIFTRDFIFKSLAFIFMMLNLLVYGDYPGIVILNAVLLAFLFLFAFIEIRYFMSFRQSADPAKTSKDNLSSLLTYLERKFPLSTALRSTTYLLTFTSGMMFYFFVEYGRVKPFTPMSIFVFSFICLMGMLFGYLIDMKQVSYHIKHIKICLSGLNDNALAMASEAIELKRKKDVTVLVLMQVLIFLGLLVIVIVLKGIMG